MDCSVIILNWNGEEVLRRFLPSVILCTPKEVAEIVVADNGSTDGSVEWLRTQPVRLILLDKNYGFAGGYNRAIAQVDTKYIVLLNSDVEVSPGWLPPLLECLHDYCNVAAVQPKIISWKSQQEFLAGKIEYPLFEHAGAAGGMLDALGYPYCRGRFLTHIEEDYTQYDYPQRIFWTSGACMVTTKQLYEGVGGLDEFFFAHQEEIDLCWRLQCRGFIMMCVPKSVVYHVGAATLSYENPKKTYQNFRNNLLMLYKNMPARHYYPVMVARFFLDYLAALQMLLTGHLANFRAVLKARRDFLKARKRYKQIRRDNIEEAVPDDYPPVIARRSIIFDYYILRKKQ